MKSCAKDRLPYCFTPNDAVEPLQAVYKHYKGDTVLGYTPNQVYVASELIDETTGTFTEGECPCCVLSDTVVEYRAPSRVDTVEGLLGADIHLSAPVTINGLAVGESETIPISFTGPRGKELEFDLIVTNEVGGNHPLTVGTTGGTGHANFGRYNWRLESRTLDCFGNPVKVNLGVLMASLQGSAEQWRIFGNVAGTADLTPATQIIWTNNAVFTPDPLTGIFTQFPTGVVTTPINNQNSVLIGYEGVSTVIADWNAQANIGSSMRLFLYGGPEAVEKDLKSVLSATQTNSVAIAKAQECLDEAKRLVYRYAPATAGVVIDRWLEAPDAVAHDLPANIWTGTPDPITGFPSHPNAPTDQIIDNDFNAGYAHDQQFRYTWTTLEEGWYRDANGNTGELGEVWIADCNGTTTLLGANATDTAGGAAGFLDPTFVKGGKYLVVVPLSDATANGGFQFQYSADNTTFANVTGPFQTTRFEVECLEIPFCDDTPDGYSDKPLKDFAPASFPAQAGLSEDEVLALIPTVPVPSTISPVADNEIDTLLRVGQAGTSLAYAREDHNHEIRRQTILADPVVTHTGTGTLTQVVVQDRGSDEESIWYRYRIRVDQIIGNNWDYVTFPVLAGFQQPLFSELGGYRSQSTSPQADDTGGNNGAGAAPRGPFMGDAPNHWSSTNRLYLPFFRREVAFLTFITVVVKYVRS